MRRREGEEARTDRSVFRGVRQSGETQSLDLMFSAVSFSLIFGILTDNFSFDRFSAGSLAERSCIVATGPRFGHRCLCLISVFVVHCCGVFAFVDAYLVYLSFDSFCLFFSSLF